MSRQMDYLLCDDWLIIAVERQTGLLGYVSTEVWPEWLDVPRKSQPDNQYGSGHCMAVEFCMLPVAMRRWDSLSWQMLDAGESFDDHMYAGREDLAHRVLGYAGDQVIGFAGGI